MDRLSDAECTSDIDPGPSRKRRAPERFLTTTESESESDATPKRNNLGLPIIASRISFSGPELAELPTPPTIHEEYGNDEISVTIFDQSEIGQFKRYTQLHLLM